MDCRHPLVPTVAGMLLVAGARVHAGEAGTPGPLQVTGGDFDLYRWRRDPRFIKHRSMDRDVELVKTLPYAANCGGCQMGRKTASGMCSAK